MIINRIRNGAREVLLSVGALLGVLCLVATIAGVAFDVKPLVFRSGSMAPAIQTGSLAISRTVDGSSLEQGDIVSVTNSSGTRVTHRVVGLAEQGEARQLTLKGDDNERADAEVYTVTKAEKVLFDIPRAGHVVDEATSPVGLFILGLYVAWILSIVVRRRPDEPDEPNDKDTASLSRGGSRRAESPRRLRAAARMTAFVAVGASLMIAGPAIAVFPWTDPVAITNTAFSTATVKAPTTLTCSDAGVGATLTFTNLDPRYTYAVEYASSQTGRAELTRHVPPSTGGTSSVTVTSGLLGGLSGSIFVRVYSVIRIGNVDHWKSADFRGRRMNVSLVLGVVACGSAF